MKNMRYSAAMETRNNKRQIVCVAAQVIYIFFAAWSVKDMFLLSGSGNMKVSRTAVFRYYTVDSNILCAITCIAAVCTQKASDKVRKKTMLFRYAGTTSVMVTMMTVLLFLVRIYGFPAMFAGWNL